MENLLLIAIFISPVLWLIKVLLTYKSKHFLKFLYVNSFIFLVGALLINFSDFIIKEVTDPYGLQILTYNILWPCIQILIIFLLTISFVLFTKGNNLRILK